MRAGQLTCAQAAIGAYNRVAADGGDEPDEDALLALYHLAEVRLFLIPACARGPADARADKLHASRPGVAELCDIHAEVRASGAWRRGRCDPSVGGANGRCLHDGAPHLLPSVHANDERRSRQDDEDGQRAGD